jgi:hypothetical protein
VRISSGDAGSLPEFSHGGSFKLGRRRYNVHKAATIDDKTIQQLHHRPAAAAAHATSGNESLYSDILEQIHKLEMCWKMCRGSSIVSDVISDLSPEYQSCSLSSSSSFGSTHGSSSNSSSSYGHAGLLLRSAINSGVSHYHKRLVEHLYRNFLYSKCLLSTRYIAQLEVNLKIMFLI